MKSKLRVEACSPAQRDFVRDETSLSLLYSGAIRSGKTDGLMYKGACSGVRHPGRRAIYTRKTLASMTRTTLDSYRRVMTKCFPPKRNADGELEADFPNPDHGWFWHHTENTVYWPNGSIDYFVACENLERMKGVEADIILVDQAEELTEEVWQFLEGRASGQTMPRSQLAAVCNPARQGMQHWLYQMFFVRKEGRAWQTKTTDNKFLPADYVKHRLSRLKGRYHAMYVLGEWVGFEGLVYPDFDPLTHVIPRFDLTKAPDGTPLDLPTYGGLDFGYINPACHLWATHDAKGRHGV